MFDVRLVFAGLASICLGTSGCSGGDCNGNGGCKPYEMASASTDALVFTSSIDGTPVDGCSVGVGDRTLVNSATFSDLPSSSNVSVGCSSELWFLDLVASGPELSTIGAGTYALQVDPHSLTDSHTLTYRGKGPTCTLPDPSLLELVITDSVGTDITQPSFRRAGTVHVISNPPSTPGDGGVCPASSLDVKFAFMLSAGDFYGIQVCELGC